MSAKQTTKTNKSYLCNFTHDLQADDDYFPDSTSDLILNVQKHIASCFLRHSNQNPMEAGSKVCELLKNMNSTYLGLNPNSTT